MAVLYGTAATVQKLSEIPGICLDAANSDLYSPLWTAANKGNMEMVRSLVEAGAHLEISGGKYLTKPLGEAVLFGSGEMVEYLISKGAYIDSRSINESTPANYAASGADLNGLYEPEKLSSLSNAILFNNSDVALFLIKSGADVNS